MSMNTQSVQKDEKDILIRNYFKYAKCFHLWKNLFFENCFFRQNFEGDKYTINLDIYNEIGRRNIDIRIGQKIILGSLKELPGGNQPFYNVCDSISPKLCFFHFTIVISEDFNSLWEKYLRKRLGSRIIKQRIAQYFGSPQKFYLEDVSDRKFSSYIQIELNQKQLIGKAAEKYCLQFEENGTRKYLTFLLKKIIKNGVQNMGMHQFLKGRLLILGTNSDNIYNKYIDDIISGEQCQSKKAEQLQSLLDDLIQENQEVILIGNNSSKFEFLLLFPNKNCPPIQIQYNQGDEDQIKEIKIYEKIFAIMKYENENYWIINEQLCKEIKKNQKLYMKKGRIITTSPKEVVDFEVFLS